METKASISSPLCYSPLVYVIFIEDCSCSFLRGLWRKETKLEMLSRVQMVINPLNPELNPICYLLALLGAHHFLHVSSIRVKSLTSRLLMSYIYIYIYLYIYIYIYIYIYGAPILDVSRSHTTTHHSR